MQPSSLLGLKRTHILPKYHQHLLLYKRQIDDIIGIWTPSPNSDLTYNDFKNDLNSVSNLNWESSVLQQSINFLDLTVSITSSNLISLKTYQRKENLFLYIPPQSAHPPGMIKSLVYNLLRTYFIQNTNIKDFQHIVHHFYQRLLARGYSPSTILPLFTTFIPKIISDPKIQQLKDPTIINPVPDPPNSPSTSALNNKLLPTDNSNRFFHLTYHPKDISRKRIQQLYNLHCNQPDEKNKSFKLGYKNQHYNIMQIDKLTIAYSRPKNLRDHLCPSKLPISDDQPSIENFISNIIYK